nr:unnamed protein product [Digitaria exilis]
MRSMRCARRGWGGRFGPEGGGEGPRSHLRDSSAERAREEACMAPPAEEAAEGHQAGTRKRERGREETVVTKGVRAMVNPRDTKRTVAIRSPGAVVLRRWSRYGEEGDGRCVRGVRT